MVTWIVVWCLIGVLVNRTIQPFWPWVEILLTSAFWPVIVAIELRMK